MLKTCIKYDLRAYRRYITLASVFVLTATLVCGALFRFFAETTMAMTNNPSEEVSVLMVISTIAVIPAYFCVIGLVISLATPSLIALWRMYTHFYTDQGYLTFTLPVKRSTLYLSKIISELIVAAIALAEFLLAALTLCIIIPPPAATVSLIPSFSAPSETA